jgi:hypothetical protein
VAIIPDHQLNQLAEDASEIKTLLKGYNGYPGLCERHENLSKDYYKFKRWVLSVFFFLLGSGALGVGIYNLVGL